MAKFQSNHTKARASQSSGMIAKVGIFSAILGALYFFFNKPASETEAAAEVVIEEDVEDLEEISIDSIFYLPTSTSTKIVQHKYFALSYLEEYELPEWVAYELTAARLKLPWVRRTNDFRPDPKISSGSAFPGDYSKTKYDRGHLAAAADMAFDESAMSESFFMSNMSPQDPGFNKGIWRELEELTRDWAIRFKHLYVITGPVFNDKIKFWIGENQVAVPPAFYKVILDINDPGKKAIAFIIPNETSQERLETYAVTIDKVEEETGIDFFNELLPNPLEESLEGSFNMAEWETDERKYELRVKEWNLQ